MTRWIALIAAVAIFTWPPSNLVAQKAQAFRQPAAQQPTAPRQGGQTQSIQLQTLPAQSDEIVPGQRLADVVAIMQKHGHKMHGGFAVMFHGPDAEDKRMIGAILDEEHTTATIVYSERDQRVLGVGLQMRLSRQSPKLEQFSLGVRKLTLHPDGSYTVHFEKPTPPRPAAERPKDVVPNFRDTRPVPGNVPSDGRF